MNANNPMVRIFKHSPKRPNGLSYPDVWSVRELANGQLLINSQGKVLDVFDRQRGLVKGYRAGLGQPGDLPEVVVYPLAQTGDATIWAGTEQSAVARQLAGSTTWVAVPGLPSKQVRKLFESRDASLWVGTDRGVARWQPKQQPPARFEVLVDERGNAMEAPVNVMAEDGQGRIWIGTDIGTLRLSAEVGAFDDGNDEVVITIADDGHGIAKEDLHKVFDPFFTTKSGLHGHVGLGLHVAYNHITQRLKGKIHVTSTLGDGTCVEIWLKKQGNLQKEEE